jgi:hypothetical protein
MWHMTNGAAREQLDSETLAHLRATGALVEDDRRRRPKYFDGRFLAARDLTREQQYFLARQADLARAGGTGVVHGLTVTAKNGTELTIGPGHGVTASGETVILPRALTVKLSDLATVQRLDASFGLSRRPTEPARNRSGLYIVALRPVEFTANPIASYPTSIADARTVEDGEIVEATVATLIPYPDDGARSDVGMRRARAAREIFVEGTARGLPVDALPLAMVLLDQGVVRWIDVFLVRREVGSSHGDVLGLGFAPRAVREAHLLQYDNHLEDVLRDRAKANRGAKFAASEHFLALPPGGRLPAATINPRDFTQSFFPPEVDVDLSIVPEDELPALLEESILLPPIDLTAGGEALESTSVLVLLPVPRNQVRIVRSALARAERATLTRTLKTAAPGLIAQRRPLEALTGLRLARFEAPLPAPVPDNLLDAAWTKELGTSAQTADGLLWYVRRRNLQYRSDVVGTSLRVATDEFPTEWRLRRRISADSVLTDQYKTLRDAASAAAHAEMVAFLSSRKISASRLLLHVAIAELLREIVALVPTDENTKQDKTLSVDAVARVAERYADAKFGDGFRNLDAPIEAALVAQGASHDLIAQLIAALRIAPEVERIGDQLAGRANFSALEEFAQKLVAAAKGERPDDGATPEEQVKTLVDATLRGEEP